MTAADSFQAAAEQIAVGTERGVLAAYAAFVAGSLDLDTAVARMAGEVNRSNAAATILADAYVVASIEELSTNPGTAVGLLPVDNSVRLVKSMRTVLTASPEQTPDEPDAEKRLTRLVHSETFSTAQKSAVDAMTAQPLVEGWVRQFESENPCQLCVFIWREGRVWPKKQPFQVMHPGDKCVPRVVLTTNPIQPVGRKRRAR
ncbi:hypothetical protein CIW52_12600 [Mycolicibacterium sp. P9-64]|uniref:hypothetical protein n=1 Tax=Mycolicibacterium sp. P9-64 TaxID=2024612 RepID=UPI0011EF3785|nr:hypothetical protein [Mycolicibacterium sp. P9-64]KAA0083269.1 hypothetical protein CIW52_12600 [Mycolicibacterium sp. P9-64]